MNLQFETGTLVEPLASPRMILRALRPSDAGLLGLYAGDARVAQMTSSIPHPYPPGAAESFIDASLAGRRAERVWAMDGSPNGASEMIGLVSARAVAPGEEEIGYWVGPPFWNTGYASEALTALIAHFRQTGMQRLHATVFEDNPVSAHVIERAGFAEVGKAAVFCVARGAAVDARLFLCDLTEQPGVGSGERGDAVP
ncbi:MAG: GNAT family N-acetyltransferase [Pseudomonadota bacterium]